MFLLKDCWTDEGPEGVAGKTFVSAFGHLHHAPPRSNLIACIRMASERRRAFRKAFRSDSERHRKPRRKWEIRMAAAIKSCYPDAMPRSNVIALKGFEECLPSCMQCRAFINPIPSQPLFVILHREISSSIPLQAGFRRLHA